MKKHLFWIIELFIWLLVLVLISSGIIITKYNYKKNFNTYQIFLPDVDGLINGSPVKLMGIQIGYVNQLDIVGEDVYVRFVVTNPDVQIPHSSIATVEFSGLGGSKSLELYPPKPGQHSSRFIITQSPKRIHESLGLLNDMFEKIADITYDVSRFMDKMGILKNKKTNNKVKRTTSSSEIFRLSNSWLDKAQKQCDKFNNQLENIKTNCSCFRKKVVNGQSDKQDK